MGGSSSTIADVYQKAGVKATVTHMVDSDTAQRLVDMLNERQSGLGPKAMQMSGMATSENEGALDKPIRGGSVKGGYGTCIGGYDALADYGNSLYSKAKEELIRNIARDVFRALKSSSADKVATAKISEVVEQLSKLVPDPRKGKNFNAEFAKSAGKQTEVCKALGSAINSNYGARIINVEAEPNEICRQVAEVMYSLFTGLHSEFMSVAGDITRILKNMDTVNDALEAAYKKQKEYAMASGDETTRQQAENTDALYDEIKKEAQRQRAMMQNLFNIVIVPSTRDLVNSLEENQDFAGLVSSLKLQTGTREFSDKLSMLLSGISSVARNAELINKALKKLGMSTAEFKASKTSDDLHMKIYSKIVASKPNSKRLGEMMKAANIIYANNYNHEAVSKLVDKSKGSNEDLDSYEVQGGDDAPAGYWRNKSLSKKIDDKKKFRETMLKDFNRLLSRQYRTIVEAANGIAQEIGKSIQLSPELDSFINLFSELPSLDRNNLHIALSGYYKDANSKQDRAKFVDKYMLVLRSIEQMPKTDNAAQFARMATGIKTMLKSLDEFSDNIVKALTEIHVDAPHEVKNGRRLEVAEFLGGNDSGDDLFNGGTWVDFKKIQNELKYYKSIANIKINISRSLADRREYSEGYEQTLGEYSGKLIDTINKRYNDLIKGLTGTTPTAANITAAADSRFNRSQDASVVLVRANVDASTAANGVGSETHTKIITNLKKVFESFQKAKINMVKVAQAVDLYMKAFSVGISSNPDMLSSTVKMLESVEMVAKWYTDKSGNNLVKLFESFPTGVAADHTAAAVGHVSFFNNKASEANASLASNLPATVGSKYYEELENRRAAQPFNLPANPFIGLPLHNVDVDQIFKLSDDSIKTMRALENILSAFQSVGSKFGDLDPQSQTFMTPGQMFNYLCDYVKASAFTTEFLPTKPRVTGAIYRSTMDAATINTEIKDNLPVPRNRTILRPQVNATAISVDIAFNNNSLSISQAHAYNASAIIGSGTEADCDNVYGILTGVSNAANMMNVNGMLATNKYSSLALAAIPADSDETKCSTWKYHASGVDDAAVKDFYRIDLAGWRDHFYDTDMLFTMTIKSIVAKVFTVVDAYRLFHRPAHEKRAYSIVAPVRTILGGASEVKIMPEALELYYRMPLLVEWYREQFRIDRLLTNDNPDYVLTMAPTIDGIFGDLTQVICEDAGNITEGNYTETQVQRIITEINNIWKQYKAKNPKATARHIINAYVLEINRVIGFIKQSDITLYLTDRRARYSNIDHPVGEDETDDFLKFDILNADGQYTTNKPAPSDRFTTTSLTNRASTVATVSGLMQQIYKMREKMDLEFNRFMRSDMSITDFSTTISNYKSELDLAKDPANEYKIVLRMMQGSSKLIEDNIDVMVMVHEAIAAPLATLYAVWRVMAKFNALMHGVSLVNIGEWNKRRAAAAHPNDIRQNDNLYKYYKEDFFEQKNNTNYNNVSNKEIFNLFASMLVGNYFSESSIKANGSIAGADCNAFNAGFLKSPAGTGTIQPVHLKSDMILQVLLNAVLDLYSNSANLTSCSIGANANINIDYKPLRDTCAMLLNNVKANILALRSSFPKSSVLDKYENVQTPGSLRWIEENLMEVLFNDRDRCGLNTGITSHLIPTITKLCNSRGNDNTAYVKPEIDSTENYGSMYQAFAGLVYYRHGPLNANQFNHARFNSTRFPFNMSQKEPFSIGPDKVNMNVDQWSVAASVGKKETVADLNPFLNIPHIAFVDYEHLNKLNPAYPVKSLMLAFNQFLRHYIYCNSDDVTLKTYLPLYESFAAGPGAYEIGQKNAFQDVFTMKNQTYSDPLNLPYTFGNPLAPPGQKSIIFNSNAIVIRQIITGEQTVGSIIKRSHLYESFAEIPESMRDKMKTNLPYFSKMFQQLYTRAEFLFKFLNNSGVKAHVERAVIANVRELAIKADDLKSSAAKFDDAAQILPTNRAAVYLTAQLTKLMELCMSIKKCSDSVYRELNDKPFYYMETNRDFITDYKSRTSNIPFMPVSSLLAPLRMFEVTVKDWDLQTDSPGQLLLPVIETSSTVFKFNSGCKIIMARDDLEPSIDQMPGAKEIFNHYNSHAFGTKITASDYATCVKNMVKLIRYVVNGAVYNRFYDAPAVSFDMLDGLRQALSAGNGGECVNYINEAKTNPDAISTQYMQIADAGRYATFVSNQYYNSSGIFASLHWTAPQFGATQYDVDNKDTMAVVPISTEPSKVIELTESTSIRFSKDFIKNILKLDKSTNSLSSTRADLRTANILDMNIVPINVHAFMREVPFVNLLNYSYTFDRMAHEFINPEYYNNDPKVVMMSANADISSTRELMVKLLVHPYADLGYDGKQYYALLASLFNGNDNMRLGIAKYLSDQLWHKVLLTSSAQLVKESDEDGFPSLEAGPSAYEATRAMIHYGTKTDSTSVGDAGFLHVFAVTAPVSQIFDLSENKSDCASGGIGTLDQHGTLGRSLADNSLINLAAEDVEGNGQITARDHVNLTANYMNGTTLSNNNLGYAPENHIALAMGDTVIFNDDSTADVHLKFRAHQADFIKFRNRLNELVFGSRVNSQKGGGIAFQADSALELVEHQEFKAFITRCGVVSGAALQAAHGAPWDDIKTTWDELHEANGQAAGADHIGHDAGAPAALSAATASHYMRPTLVAVPPNAASDRATARAQLRLQVTDLMHMCFVTHNGNVTDLLKVAANQVRDKLHSARKQLDDIDITATSAIPISIRGSAAVDALAGFQCTTSLGYASSDDIYNGIAAELKIANLPGADAILVVFNEFLHLMRPFRNNKSLRNLANTLFMGSLYRTTRAKMLNYLSDNRILNGNNKRWVRYVVEYMKNRILTQRDGGGGAPSGYTLRVDGNDIGSAAHGTFDAVASQQTVANPHSNVMFVQRMRELIALSYCNSFLVVEELIPQALQNNRANIYLSIASLPNMTRGLKIRDTEKGKKTWKLASKNPMATEEIIYCAEIGRARFDTKIVRNLTWFVQLQRVMRVVLTNHLSWINSPVVRGLKIADSSMTELHGNEEFDAKAFTGESYNGKI